MKTFWGKTKLRERRNREQGSLRHAGSAPALSTPAIRDNSVAPPRQAVPEHFPVGVKVLFDCADAKVDICFVHGLTGDRERTWTADGQSSPWPGTLLPPLLSNARILTYGYDAFVVRMGVAGSNGVDEHASNLISDLTTDREACNATSRPLIFVAHSLGGLVCKRAILRSLNNPDLHRRDIFDSLKGVVFMGTPHRGTAWMATWAKLSVSALLPWKSTNKSILEVLQANSDFLRVLLSDFAGMVRQCQNNGRTIGVECFFEELPMPVVGHVVSMESATFDDRDPISIHANHRDMVRFASSEDTGLIRLSAVLRRWIRDCESSKTEISPHVLQKCLQSLAFPSMFDRSRDIETAFGRTCGWLLCHRQYMAWDEEKRALLWIKGKPGSGKSTLLKYALNHRMSAVSNSCNNLVLSFFFHGRGDDLQKTPLGFFRSLVHQVLLNVPDAISDLVDEYVRKCNSIGQPGQDWEWHEEELWEIFRTVLPKLLKTHAVCLFVDALDEAGEENARTLIDRFKGLLDIFRPVQHDLNPFHLCFACRPYPVQDWDGGYTVCPEECNGDDISTFVNAKLSSDYWTTSAIPGMITHRASGVFLWARLVLHKVLELRRKGYGVRKLQEAVSHVPESLHQLYTELIVGMDVDSIRLVHWVLFARRPLRVSELPWAIAISHDDQYESFDALQKEKDVPDGKSLEPLIHTLGRGLVEVTHSSDIEAAEHRYRYTDFDPEIGFDFNPENGFDFNPETGFDFNPETGPDVERAATVQFIHQSVKDFFIEKGLSILAGGSLSVHDAIGVAQSRLSIICIRYFAMKEVGQVLEQPQETKHAAPVGKTLNEAFPFLRYAIMSWMDHARESDNRGQSQRVLLDIFMWPSWDLTTRWTNLCEIFDVYWYMRLSGLGPKFSLVHAASFFGIVDLVRLVRDRPDAAAYLGARDERGQSPLLIAAETGSEAIVSILLGTREVQPDSRDIHGLSPLAYATRNGYIGIVRQLLETGLVDPDGRDNRGQTPLHYAAMKGDVDVFKVLLETGRVDPASRDIEGQAALHFAAIGGHASVVEILLETCRIDPSSTDAFAWTPLSGTAEHAIPDAIGLFFGTGKADPGRRYWKRMTTLSLAVRTRNESVVKVLLETGRVDPNRCDEDGITPLALASHPAYHERASGVKIFEMLQRYSLSYSGSGQPGADGEYDDGDGATESCGKDG